MNLSSRSLKTCLCFTKLMPPGIFFVRIMISRAGETRLRGGQRQRSSIRRTDEKAECLPSLQWTEWQRRGTHVVFGLLTVVSSCNHRMYNKSYWFIASASFIEVCGLVWRSCIFVDNRRWSQAIRAGDNVGFNGKVSSVTCRERKCSTCVTPRNITLCHVEACAFAV